MQPSLELIRSCVAALSRPYPARRPARNRLPQPIGGGMIVSMPRNRTHPPAPDLFSEATPRDAFPAPENQIPSPKPAIDEAAANSLHRYVLPKDLPGALKQLDDSELASLLAAALDEAKGRDKLRPGLVASAQVGKPSLKSIQGSKARQGHSAAPSLTRGQVNAVRAAFRAGIGPSRIALGISKANVHKVLASDAQERGRRS
jgi:hypothetical protein